MLKKEFLPRQINLGLSVMKQNQRKSIKQVHQSRHHYRVDQCVCGLTQLHTIAFVIVILALPAFVFAILVFSLNSTLLFVLFLHLT